MQCPWYKKGKDGQHVCMAAKELKISKYDTSFCGEEEYDECRVFREYIGRQHNENFARIFADPR